MTDFEDALEFGDGHRHKSQKGFIACCAAYSTETVQIKMKKQNGTRAIRWFSVPNEWWQDPKRVFTGTRPQRKQLQSATAE